MAESGSGGAERRTYQRSRRHVARARGVHGESSEGARFGCFSGSQDSGPIARSADFFSLASTLRRRCICVVFESCSRVNPALFRFPERFIVEVKRLVRKRTKEKMATDTLSERLSTKLHLQTKKVGEDRIRRAKEKDEDIAIFSMFSLEGDPKFRCCLGKDCLLGDPKKADPGTKKMEYKTRQWHEKCFCCVVCKNPIGTKSFIPREQEIYCAACYEDKFATRCVKCNKIITSGGVTYKNEPWHRDCFTCSNCNNSLAGQRFTSRDDKPYCADCFGELFAKRCTACSKPITGIGGTRFISFEDRHWHNDCFICAGCKTSLVGRGFITDGEDIICPDCAKMKFM